MMMNKAPTILNSIQEVVIRMLAQLYVLEGKKKNSDYISCLDYLTLYSKTFKFGSYDLHGQMPYRLGELSSRLELGKESLKSLVAMGLCSVEASKNGFIYSITASGKNVINRLNTNYINNYINLAIDAQVYFNNYTDVDLLKYINGIAKAERR